MMPWGDHMDPSWYSWMTGGSMLLWLGLAALVVFAVVRLTRRATRSDDAYAILDQRFARGEINAEEHRTRRAHLMGR